jgi:hypothetical protein
MALLTKLESALRACAKAKLTLLVDVSMAEERLLHSASPLRFVDPAERLRISDVN